jgi:uncharacterized membrane protein YdbT with pleckstrin-like domain
MAEKEPNPPQASTGTAKEIFTAAAANREVDSKEEALWSGGYSAKAMYGTWLVLFLLTVVLIVPMFSQPAWILVLVALIGLVWLSVGLLLAYRKFAVSYELTTQRFIHREGIFIRRTDRIEVIDIDDVTFTQGLVQRILGVGKIDITSSDRSHPHLILPGIDDVARVAEMIDHVRRQERRRRGLHIENI